MQICSGIVSSLVPFKLGREYVQYIKLLPKVTQKFTTSSPPSKKKPQKKEKAKTYRRSPIQRKRGNSLINEFGNQMSCFNNVNMMRIEPLEP